MMGELPEASKEDLAHAAGWLRVAGRAEVAHRLEAIYELIADQVKARGPVCDASGRCCHFEAYGHRLYVTGLEAACFVRRLPKATPGLSLDAVADALRRGGCPFQIGLLCGVHGARPMGCRTYYCDPTAAGWQEALNERCHGMIRDLHARFGVAYRYMEWRTMLALIIQAESFATQSQERT